jgi:hypothetical protein
MDTMIKPGLNLGLRLNLGLNLAYSCPALQPATAGFVCVGAISIASHPSLELLGFSGFIDRNPKTWVN